MGTDPHNPRSMGAMRDLLIAAGAALVLVIVAVLFVWRHGNERTKAAQKAAATTTNVVASAPHPPPVPTGSIKVASEPAGAEVWLFARRTGTTPASVDKVEEGSVTVIVRKEGYRSATLTGDVRQGTCLALSARLDKIEGPVPAQPWTVPELNLTMVWIPSGSFTMGGASGETNEAPGHRVTITKGFWIGTHEVTKEQWLQVMEYQYPRSGFVGSNLPIEMVSWNNCVDFCARLTDREREACRLQESLAYRLPTEAEWEYACRAGTTTEFCHGASLDATMANFDGRHPVGGGQPGDYRKKTVPVGSFKPNPWGMFDMHGNVYEWCADWYGDYTEADATDPHGPKDGTKRVARGGSWYDYGSGCRAAFREVMRPEEQQDDVGMRLILGEPLPEAGQ